MKESAHFSISSNGQHYNYAPNYYHTDHEEDYEADFEEINERIDLIEEIDRERTEFDVEKVLAKQSTHELYCPNCNCCITRRIILRRKPKFRNPRRQPKHYKAETPFHYQHDPDSLCAAHDTGIFDGEQDVFRCLSCFSIFIPTGNGFKLFRVFEDSTEQNPQKSAEVKANWFFSIFATNQKKTKTEQGNDLAISVETEQLEPSPQSSRNVVVEDRILLESGARGNFDEQRSTGVGVDILKSIVYGGLIESITSLGVICSAAGAGAATLDILAMALANLIGGLFIIGYNLIDLKNEGSRGSSSEINQQDDRYQALLGKRDRFSLHVTVVIISYLIFGVLPPIVYGFSFHKSDDKDLKLALVGGASLVCIILLAIGRAYVFQKPYIRNVLYYVIIGFMASGSSYIVGDLIRQLMQQVGWFHSSLSLVMPYSETKSNEPLLTSY
ncbi:hypothetical protein K2173_021847 [Erythroxylum novogranatense]|uniref:Membrane protein of ER body-like protein n=1 Tax=Erythroxylum novogranatense TaxID=1862640 RepID=A0AAV8T3A9_9ROSI|nr:hypothetical protein K2173_021847 [Erythroxylum novogranatense]